MAKPIRKRWAADRRPLKVNVSETEEVKKETPAEEEAETSVDSDVENAVDTVEENKIQEEETVEGVKPLEEEKPSKKTNSVKEWTEDELVALPREEMYAVIADIKAGKAKIKPRTITH